MTNNPISVAKFNKSYDRVAFIIIIIITIRNKPVEQDHEALKQCTNISSNYSL